MYYAKYIKYKNKYLNLKYQLGGTFITPLIRREDVKELDSTIPEVSTSLVPDETLRSKLIDNLVGIRVLKSDSIILAPLVKYNKNKKFRSNPINFYVYRDKSGDSNPEYVLCSLYNYYEILFELQKKNVKIRRCNVDENGNVTLKLKDIIIPDKIFEIEEKDKVFQIERKDKVNIQTKLKEDLVGVKVLESNTKLLELLSKNFKKIHYYRYKKKEEDRDVSYILLSLYDYYEFLDILYEHIEIEEVNIDDKGKITPVSGRIYHIIPKPQSVSSKEITLLPMVIPSLDKLVEALKLNLFIIIRNNNLLLLPAICMYNLFIGTIHVYAIYEDDLQSAYFLLSLFTQHELNQKGISKPYNVTIKECRLYKQGDKIDFKLNEDFVGMMFDIYNRLRNEGHYANKLYRGNLDIDNKFLNELDPTLLEKCKKCISVKDIAFNTTLCLLPDKIGAKDHKDILEMEKDFLKNKFELINSNEKLYLWRYKYEDLIQLWEYSLENLGNEVKKFKEELLGLEPCHQELLVLKLNEKGFAGRNMDEILQNSALCYLEDGDKEKKLLYENTNQIDPIDNEFVRNCKFIPKIKKLLEKRDSGENIESELHKYRQTVLFYRVNNINEKKYLENQSYFFANSWYEPYDEEVFSIFTWSYKLNKLCFQCLVMKENLIFPLRIVNFNYLKTPLSLTFNKDKQEFCGYLHTRFTDDYDGIYDFKKNSRDKLLLIYSNHKIGYITESGKKYELFYYTGNSIWLNSSILPYYKVIVCEINWIYYTFILKYNEIPHFYEYINDYCEKEIVVSRFSLEEIRCKYEENGYDVSELAELTEVFYNHNYYKIENETDSIFINYPLLQSVEEQKEFKHNVYLKNKNRV